MYVAVETVKRLVNVQHTLISNSLRRQIRPLEVPSSPEQYVLLWGLENPVTSGCR